LAATAYRREKNGEPEMTPGASKASAHIHSRRIAIGVAAGVGTGVFLGEAAGIFQPVADGFVRLLQMTVLPYVTIAIISGLGSLDPVQAKTLGKRVGLVLVLLWAFAIAAALLVGWIFPVHESASFFSTTLLEERESFDFLGLYIPTNPFNSLANNVVPAVVLFSMVVGLALIGVPNKEHLIDVLTIANRAIARATAFIVALTPIGVFAIAATVSGTLGLETMRRLQVYLVSYVGISLLVSLWLLPGLIAALTPVPFRAVMSRMRDALVLAFMTTSLFAVLPLLTEEVKGLLREYAPERDAESLPEVIVPTSFNFPHTGKLLSLSFVLFAAWFSNTAVTGMSYLRLAGTGLVVMFGNVNAAIPFLLDLLHVPSDTFGLFLTSSAINARFGTLVAAMHTVTIAIVGTCAVTGALRFDARRLAGFAVVTTVLTVGTVGGLRLLLQLALHTPYDQDLVLQNMQALRERGDAHVFRPGDPVPALPPPATTIASRLSERRLLRVGYFDDSLPYVFFNARQELVGFDVEMAEQLASDLGVGVEFVPVSRRVLDEGLSASACDLVMSGAVISADRVLHVQFTEPYLDETLAFIVPDDRTSEFGDWERVRRLGRLRVAMPAAPYFIHKIREELGDVEIVPIATLDDMFRPRDRPVDAFVATAERGSAYTIMHPQYSVVVPKPRPMKVPLAYVVAGRDVPFANIVNTWIDLKRKDGTIDQLFAHWILGRQATPSQPRWSVVRNVLHLVK
jgi:Na+/H+-dicarboxylate symporter/ABC-type amino acid transport substrate-binding protein